MKPVFQTKRGIGGNCLAACLASIFEVSLESIPDLAPVECCTDGTVQGRLRKEWLAQRGMDYLEIDLEKQAYHWVSLSVPTGPCLFAVESRNPEVREKGYGHFVVGKIREAGGVVEYIVTHDPLGELNPPYKVTAVGFFVQLDPSRVEKLRADLESALDAKDYWMRQRL